MSTPSDTTRSFTHQSYTESQFPHRIFINWLTRPLIFCLTPVMISILFLALQEQRIGWLLKIGIPIAVVFAAGWTLLQLARTPALVSFRNDRVRIKTFLEAAFRSDLEKWHFVIDVRVSNEKGSNPDSTPALTAIMHGHTAYEFRENDWEHFRTLTHRLKEARQSYEQKTRAATA